MTNQSESQQLAQSIERHIRAISSAACDLHKACSQIEKRLLPANDIPNESLSDLTIKCADSSATSLTVEGEWDSDSEIELAIEHNSDAMYCWLTPETAQQLVDHLTIAIANEKRKL